MALPAGVTKLGEFQGERGPKGDTGTFASASATTLAAGAQATVAISGPESAKEVVFGIPRGNTGATGSTGPAGTITGATATGLAAGASPTVTLGGTASARTFAFGIPAGAQGVQGLQGVKGDKGDPGDATTLATTTTNGVVRLATQAEIDAGNASSVPTATQARAAIDAAKPVNATTTVKGLVELATQTESNNGTAGVVPDAAAVKASFNAWETLLRPLRTRAVFIGSSNALSGATLWPTKLCALRGWTQHNFAIGGTGYCTPSQPFLTHAQAAVAAMSTQERAEVGHFFVADASNDARSNRTHTEMRTAATTLYQYIATNFPNATIVVLPQVWPADTEKYAPTASFPYDPKWATSAIVGANAQREALRGFPRGLFADHSWTWLTGDDSLMTANADVHPNAAGHDVITHYLHRVLNGETIEPATGWVPLSMFASTTTGGRGRDLMVMRRGWDVFLEGSALRTAEFTGTTQDYATLPYGYRPTFQVNGTAFRWDASGTTGEPSVLELYPNGVVRLGGTATGSRRGIATAIAFRIG